MSEGKWDEGRKTAVMTFSGSRFVSSLPMLSILSTESVVRAKTLPMNLAG